MEFAGESKIRCQIGKGFMAKVNKEKCIGCGLCAALCPEIFELAEDGKAQTKEKADFTKDCVREAKESCPAGAIEE